MPAAPPLRLQVLNDVPVNPRGEYVLYWMIANRRTTWNFSLEEAVSWAENLNKPLLVLEALRAGYPWASARLHKFIIDGMTDNAGNLAKAGVAYYPYLERNPGEGKGLLEALARKACLVVTDHFPDFFLPPMVAAAAQKIPVRLIQVDANGLLPLRAADHAYPTAYAFRRFIQKNNGGHLTDFPQADPFLEARLPTLKMLPSSVIQKWPKAPTAALKGSASFLSGLAIDHGVKAVDARGGSHAARSQWKRFLERGFAHYLEFRNEPEAEGTSGLSPYLHFGHISTHQIFKELMDKEGWSLPRLPEKTTGRRGWWGVSEGAEMFLDQLITWRELGYNLCARREDYERYESLPLWAQKTLSDHANDRRPYKYTPEQFEFGKTHDPLWNAAQMQLVREGRLHNYLRMLWGKKILEWSEGPQDALRIMIELNNKYALDGRDPNSYSGIFWVLGRYDRPWGPERPVFGKIRYMSSENTARKLKVRDFIKKYGPE
ncbi:MAG: deoxyribodipyrimidine photolyase [Deltaproteobacteria bacterium]|nr:deoxyribodipyrimidine photolyase [Deltaproteobacteria bacterium]